MQFLKLRKYNHLKNYFLFLISLFFLLGFSAKVSAQKKYTVVLDAGHGGKDPGNVGNGYKEAKVALRVALDVGKELLTARDIEVIYTRKKDVFVELHNRAKIANTKKADLFVSIHCDAFHKSEPNGASTFVLGLNGNKENLEISKRENAVILLEDNYEKNYDYDPNSPESVIGLSVLQEENLDNSLGIASFVQGNFVALKRNNRKVKQANFLVLRETVMPSVLIELGFLTNKKEGAFLNSKKGQKQMAISIAKSIKEYINQLKINTIVTDVLVESTSNIEFKIQIASGKNKIAVKSYNFKGLHNIERIKIGSYYKYYYGNTSDYQQVKKSLSKAKQKGYKDAFVIALKNGEKVSVQDAMSNQ